MQVSAASSNAYRVVLPDGTTGFIASKAISPTTTALSRYQVKAAQEILDRPSDSAAVKSTLRSGQKVEVLGSFDHYQLVLTDGNEVGWVRK